MAKARKYVRSTKSFVALNGVSIPDEEGEYTNYEPGDEVVDVPEDDVAWLVEQGHLREKE